MARQTVRSSSSCGVCPSVSTKNSTPLLPAIAGSSLTTGVSPGTQYAVIRLHASGFRKRYSTTA